MNENLFFIRKLSDAILETYPVIPFGNIYIYSLMVLCIDVLTNNGRLDGTKIPVSVQTR